MKKLLFIGDSWGHYLGQAAKKFNTAQNINLDMVPDFEQTTIIGSTASKFARNHDLYMDNIKSNLDNQDADIIIFSLGGNDFYNLGHFNDLSIAEERYISENFDKIKQYIIKILTKIREWTVAPIIVSGYDYFNINKLVDLFSPDTNLKKLSTEKFNELMIYLGTYLSDATTHINNCMYIINWGLIQHTYNPDMYKFPYGKIGEPTDLKYIPDGMHPTLECYNLLLTNDLKTFLAKKNQSLYSD